MDKCELALVMAAPAQGRSESAAFKAGGNSMSLKDRLDAIREASAKRIPPDRQAIMHRATTDLRASGILDRIVKVGQPMPAFSGLAHDGRAIGSTDLLARGPLVLSFFRGHW
jgi:hypothetical protein